MNNSDVMTQNVMSLSNATVLKLLNCEHCSKSFPTNYHLKQHMLTHTTEKVRLLNCEHCSKSFYSHSHLKQHLALHSGKKPHHCQHSDKSFSRKDALTSHMKVHEKPAKAQQCQPLSESATNSITVCKLFCCEQCSKSFPTRSHLKQHMLTHNREKPHHCEHFNKSFARKDYLVSHMKIHEQSKVKSQGLYPYQFCTRPFSINITVCKLFYCKYCSKYFPKNSRLV